jgi:hypothetical protein
MSSLKGTLTLNQISPPEYPPQLGAIIVEVVADSLE